jgi:transposase-like protein
MNPPNLFCLNEHCPKHGISDEENLVRHSRKERRWRCLACGVTFAEDKGTPFYRLRTDAEVVTQVITLLAWGCPVQAIVQAFDLDERTVQDWTVRAGAHCRRVHEEQVASGQVNAPHVQADEIWVKMVRRKVWMALAIAVPSHLWLAGVVSAQRDGALIRTLALGVRRCLTSLGILLCVDGCASYVTEFRALFRVREERGPGRPGRPRWIPAPGFLLGQVIKSYVKRQVAAVSQRAVCGTMAEIVARVRATGGTMIHTAYIERFNATFRSRMAGLVRRTRNLLHQERMLRAGMYLVGCVYNFCTPHGSLREELPAGSGAKWGDRSPAMAAGLTDHVWSVSELLHHRVVPSQIDLAVRRGKRRKGGVNKPPRAPLEARMATTV